MQNFTVNQILTGIKKHDNIVLSHIYSEFFKEIENYIIRNSGDKDDARDVFQEALIVIYRQLKEDDLKLNCSFNTYLYSVCRLQWLKQLKHKKVVLENIDETEETVSLDENLDLIIEDNEKYELFHQTKYLLYKS